MDDTWLTIEDIHHHLRTSMPFPDDQHLQLRVLKVQEEAGEAAQALLGLLGGSLRKGRSHSRDDLAGELCDVITTGMVALREAVPDAEQVFVEHLARLRARGDAGTARPARPARPAAVEAVHLLLRDGDRLLLGTRLNTGWCDGMYQVPSGHVEDETALTAVVREAREETGIVLDPGQVRLAHVMHRRSERRRTDFFFEATRWAGAITNREPDKCGGWDFLPTHALPAQTVPYLAAAIGSIARGESYSEYGWEQP